MLYHLRAAAQNTADHLLARIAPRYYKGLHEMKYWRQRKVAEGELSNSHYEPLYTTVYGLTGEDYAGKRILDIGCGPRGSLEWCHMALQRVGLDPLVRRYRELGTGQHKMEYCAAPSERIPYLNGHFDIVTCINALDHVDDYEATVSEIKRVTKSGGLFLLSTEIDHPPTPTEPVTVTEQSLRRFAPEFRVLSERFIGTPPDHNLHRAVQTGKPPYIPGQPGIYFAKMKKT